MEERPFARNQDRLSVVGNSVELDIVGSRGESFSRVDARINVSEGSVQMFRLPGRHILAVTAFDDDR